MGQKYLGIDIDVDHIVGKLNNFADAVSRGRSSKNLNIIYKKEYRTNKAALTCLQVDSSVKKCFNLLSPKSITKIAHLKRSIGERHIVPSRAKQEQLRTNCLRTIYYI